MPDNNPITTQIIEDFYQQAFSQQQIINSWADYRPWAKPIKKKKIKTKSIKTSRLWKV